jgi:hypothetical protein
MPVENVQGGENKMEITEVIPQLEALEGEIREKLIEAMRLVQGSKLALEIPLDEYNNISNVSSNPGLDALAKICKRYNKQD